MTREEAHDIIIGFQAGRIDVDSHAFYHALDFVVDLLESQPSSPQGLDEAAEEYGLKESHGDYNYVACWHRDGFKAGAKWMAEHGEAVKGELSIREHIDRDDIYVGFTLLGSVGNEVNILIKKDSQDE